MPDLGPQDLQFQHAEPIPETPAVTLCVVCQQAAGDGYYQAQGQIVCAECAQRIDAVQQAAPPVSLWRAALYGGGAALAGSVLYALVAIVLHVEIGIVAILVGWMVGKAIHHACNGQGGRPQQILAVALTYFAITTSYLPILLYLAGSGGHSSFALYLAAMAAVAPFLSLTTGISAWISLFILFIGLQRAWKLTERRQIQLTGPFPA